MKKRKALAILFWLIVSLGLAAWAERQISIDGCLDRGGRWDGVTAECEGASG